MARPSPARPSPGRRPPAGPAAPRVPNLLMRVWDAPTRLFHWALVLMVALSYVSSQRGWVWVHFQSGYAVLALLLFRLAWGFAGSETSRFGTFLRSPAQALQNLATFAKRGPDTQIGHNAAGGWMVLAMLLALALEVGAGLFSNNDIAEEGPLAHYVAKAASDWATHWHHRIFNVVWALAALHVLAVVAYAVVKRHDLVRAMVTGKKRLPATLRQPRFASPLLALAVMAGAAGLVWALVRFA